MQMQSGNSETVAERDLRIVSEQGVPHAAVIVEILKPFDQQTLAGPMPFAIVGGEIMPLASAVVKLRELNPGLARLFDRNGKLDYR
jgi:hypothetical protein